MFEYPSPNPVLADAIYKALRKVRKALEGWDLADVPVAAVTSEAAGG